MFNPEAFMQTQVEEEFSETRPLIPAGEYMTRVEDTEAKVVGENNLPVLNMKLRIVNSGDEETEGRVLYHTIWLDVDDAGNLRTGASDNVGLGQFLAALGLNGKPWNPTMFDGQVILAKVGNRVSKRTGEPEDYVQRVAKAA